MSNVVSLDEVRHKNFPMIGLNGDEIFNLIQSFVSQCLNSKHKDFSGEFTVGKYLAKVDIQFTEKDNVELPVSKL